MLGNFIQNNDFIYIFFLIISLLMGKKWPLISNRYFEDKEGIINKFCQINVKNSGEIQVYLIKNIEKRPYVPLTPKISVDFGLRNLYGK